MGSPLFMFLFQKHLESLMPLTTRISGVFLSQPVPQVHDSEQPGSPGKGGQIPNEGGAY